MKRNVRLFLSKFDENGSDCWEWQGAIDPNGYGRYGCTTAHRVAYEHFVGPIPDGLHLDHLCRNPLCVNPAHLDPVSPGENARRGLGVRLTHEQAAEVRLSSLSSGELAKRLGVTRGAINDVRANRTWNFTDREVETIA